jgi:predicted HD phosphohydrolase
MVENINELFKLYLTYGNEDYIGENVSQIEHALQCANLAEKDGFPIQTVLAAFLHDIGHLLGQKLNKPQMKSFDNVYGVEDHEKLGANYLRNFGVPENICYLVENHVFGKRYLVYKV